MSVHCPTEIELRTKGKYIYGNNKYGSFGLGRFATDHSLTKAASRLLFVRVGGATRLNGICETPWTESECMIIPFNC